MSDPAPDILQYVLLPDEIEDKMDYITGSLNTPEDQAEYVIIYSNITVNTREHHSLIEQSPLNIRKCLHIKWIKIMQIKLQLHGYFYSSTVEAISMYASRV